MPMSIHENSGSNVHNSFISRNCRELKPDVEEDECAQGVFEDLEDFCSDFFIDIDILQPEDVYTLIDYVNTRDAWSKGKKNSILNAADKVIKAYGVSLFVKREIVFKSDLAAPRLICNPSRCSKKRWNRFVFSLTKHIKPIYQFGTNYNKTSKNINLIWTSGMNRDQMGATLKQQIEYIQELDETVIYVSADYSKYESTQIEPIMKNIRTMYGQMTCSIARKELMDMAAAITGKKTAYVNIDDCEQGLYKFFATRSSGDGSTTLGNTILGFLLGCFMLRAIPIAERKKVFLNQSGDDGLYVMPQSLFHYFDTSELEAMGMKLDIIPSLIMSEVDYNSSILLPVEVDGERRLNLSAKLGRLLCRCPFSIAKYDETNKRALQFQKAMAMVQELRLWPGIRHFYSQVMDMYKEYSKIKIKLKYKDLVTLDNIKPTFETIEYISRRYNISASDYHLINEVFARFDPNIHNITCNTDYNQITHLIKKIVHIDCVVYKPDDEIRFEDYFNELTMQQYYTHFSGSCTKKRNIKNMDVDPKKVNIPDQYKAQN